MVLFLVLIFIFFVLILIFESGWLFVNTIDHNFRIIAKLLHSEVEKPFPFLSFFILQRKVTGYYQDRKVTCYMAGSSGPWMSGLKQLYMETRIRPKKQIILPIIQQVTEYTYLRDNKVYYRYSKIFWLKWDRRDLYSLERIKFTEEDIKFFFDELLKAAKIVETQYPDGVVKDSSNRTTLTSIIYIICTLGLLFALYLALRPLLRK